MKHERVGCERPREGPEDPEAVATPSTVLRTCAGVAIKAPCALCGYFPAATPRTSAHGFITRGLSSASLCDCHLPESNGDEFVSIYVDAQTQCGRVYHNNDAAQKPLVSTGYQADSPRIQNSTGRFSRAGFCQCMRPVRLVHFQHRPGCHPPEFPFRSRGLLALAASSDIVAKHALA